MTLAPNGNVVFALASVVGLLATVQAALPFIARRAAPALAAELALRVKSWWVMVAIFGAALLLGRELSIVSIGCVSFLALREYVALAPTRAADRPALALAYLAIPVQYAFLLLGWPEAFALFVPAVMPFCLSVALVLRAEPKGALSSAAAIFWGLVIAVYAPGWLALLVALPEAGSGPGGGAGLMLYLVALAQLSDVVQYAAGKLAGHRRVIPSISPGKSWEGLAAGLAATLGAAVALAPVLTPFSAVEAAASGALIGAAGFLGDLTISAFKRDCGVKDTGTIIPGHGGVLDRIDASTA
jgi:phosphatidate cytidylyltransferase